MSNYYDFNSDNNNNNELSHYPILSDGPTGSPEPDKKPSKRNRNKKKNLAKRIGTLTLSAVLSGPWQPVLSRRSIIFTPQMRRRLPRVPQQTAVIVQNPAC